MVDVTSMLRPERAALVELLRSLEPDDWDRPTECPAYSIKGVATHVLGDDLSLLSRQRDQATNGLLLVAEEMAGADFRTILDLFNDTWVSAARFFSAAVLVDLLLVVPRDRKRSLLVAAAFPRERPTEPAVWGRWPSRFVGP